MKIKTQERQRCVKEAVEKSTGRSAYATKESLRCWNINEMKEKEKCMNKATVGVLHYV